MDDDAPDNAPAGTPGADDDPFHIPPRLRRAPPAEPPGGATATERPAPAGPAPAAPRAAAEAAASDGGDPEGAPSVAPFLRRGAGDRAGFVREIRAQWRDAVGSILAVGRLLIRAKETLPHGEFETMIGGQLPFAPRTAERLMAIARDERIAKATHGSLLPPSWRTLYEITRLDDTAFERALADKIIRPDVERREIEALIKQRRRSERLDAIAGSAVVSPPDGEPPHQPSPPGVDAAGDFPPLDVWAAGRTWPVILADPPWRYEDPPMGLTDRSIENHYETMSLEEICAVPLPEVATETALLFLWATAPNFPAAYAAVQAWGFRYRTGLVWVKDKIAMGSWARNRHELLLVATRGAFPPPAPEHRPDSVFEAPATEHSVKPDDAHRILERAYPELPKVELFARDRRPGWDAWGKGLPPLALPAPARGEGEP